MGKWAAWRHMVEASKREALEAVAHYNRPLADRGLEGFFMHMHASWLYLLHAEFKRDNFDYRYHLPNGRLDKVDGEAKCWELAKCAQKRWPDHNDPTRANVDLTVLLRNKVEHRWTEGLTLMVAGKAQALITNYEDELVTQFGEKHSLGNSLRFPLYVGVMSRDGAVRLAKEQAKVGSAVGRIITEFEQGLDPATLEDTRYETRVHLIERSGPKSEPDMAIEFVRESELSDETLTELRGVGRQGNVIVRDVERPVQYLGWMKPAQATERIRAALPFRFTLNSFAAAWRKLGVRPASGAAHPERTKREYCVYDKPHGDYVYSEQYIAKVIDTLSSEVDWAAFFGKPPIRNVTPLRDVG